MYLLIWRNISAYFFSFCAHKMKAEKKTLDSRHYLVGKKIKQMRIDAGYTSYEDFAFDNKLSRIHYWRIEKGTNFSFEYLLRILDIHKVDVDVFFNDIRKTHEKEFRNKIIV